jgi:membrane protease YdiL (CAAX protease family)
MLALPALLLTFLIVGYVVSRGGEVVEAELRAVLPVLIAANHTVVFAVLLLVLRREGRTLGDIGWRVSSGRGLVRELAVGVAFGLAFYLLKELGFDSIRALAAGAEPTFTTLFRFRPSLTELPLLLVATTFIAVEESVYRGYGLPPLRSRWGVVVALAVMGVLFGLLHWGNGGLAIVFTGTLGVLYGVLFLWRGTLVAPVAGHALYNALVILT